MPFKGVFDSCIIFELLFSSLSKTKKINFELLISKYNVREEIFIFYFKISWLLIL